MFFWNTTNKLKQGSNNGQQDETSTVNDESNEMGGNTLRQWYHNMQQASSQNDISHSELFED